MHWLQCQRHEVQRQKAYVAFRRDLMIQKRHFSHQLIPFPPGDPREEPDQEGDSSEEDV